METIRKRTSVRTFEDKEIPKETFVKLENFIAEIEPEYSYKYRFPIINSKIDGKVGTYGVISGANYFICGIVKKDDHCLIDLGYIFEKIIIFATALGLGTCWLGGTFNREEFSNKSKLKDTEKFIVATPIGFQSKKKSIREKAMRKIAKSDNRKKFDEIFFNADLKPIDTNHLANYQEALETVRIGPSASNKQPWRIITDNNSYHLYLARTPDYAKDLGYDIQLLDMGIAKYHFEYALKKKAVEGKWVHLEKPPIYEKLEYIDTWTS